MEVLAPDDLAAAALLWREQEVTVEDVADAYLRADVYAVRTPDRVGVLVSGSRTVCVFSSLERLAAAVDARPDTPRTWLRTTGRDLLEQLPEGVNVVVDAVGPVPVLLTSAVLVERAQA